MMTWKIDEALGLIRDIQSEANQFGYHIALGGGVLNKGESKYTIDDYPELQRRAYVFNKGRLRFQCFFSSRDSNVCKFVQVGVKEQPIYKLMCGEDVVDSEAEVVNS